MTINLNIFEVINVKTKPNNQFSLLNITAGLLIRTMLTTALMLTLALILSCGGMEMDGALGTVTINLPCADGITGARYVTPETATLTKITYTVKLEGKTNITLDPVVPGQEIKLRVAAGQYTITVTAWLEGVVYAEGCSVFNIEAGRNNTVNMGISVTGKIFTSIAEFSKWLSELPANNTPETAYRVKLNVSDLGGTSSDNGSVGNAIRTNAGKYISLDLSDSTFTNLPFTGTGATALGAFAGCTNLTDITLPNTVTAIGQNAFVGCTSLTSITIPDRVTSIGEWAFSGCTGLTTVTIPNSVKNIGKNAFEYCTSLASVTIPNSVQSIEFMAFFSCEALASVETGNGVTSIKATAFANCKSLKSITIPKSVTSIDYGAFNGCSSLKTVIFAEGSNIQSTNFASDAFDGVFGSPATLQAAYTDTNNGGKGTYELGSNGWYKTSP